MDEPELQKLVSVVLPTHNGARHLEEAIRSVVGQTLAHWELVIVDDGSTDSSPALAEYWAARDPRIRVVWHESNKKLPVALNTGFARARGEYFTWISDDNCFRPQALEQMRQFLDEHSEVDIVYAYCTKTDETGREIGPETVLEPSSLVQMNSIGCCFLYRRGVHERLGGYDERMFLAEDYDFWLRASIEFRLQLLREDLCLYRRHEGSLTSHRQLEAWERANASLLAHLPSMTWLGRQDRALGWLRLQEFAWERHNIIRSVLFLWRAYVSSPATVGRRTASLIIGRRVLGRLSDLRARLGRARSTS